MIAQLGTARKFSVAFICIIANFRVFGEFTEGYKNSEGFRVKDGRLAGCVDDKNHRETTSATAQALTRATRHC